ncbi:hypothetical protein [Rickettsia hoogstraalii]|uniref:hypothetical protein n=1 Tax=Rickettsia hoogstraalii TaxID=467174 RepID=UPI0012E0B07D|nr:hypothetical protein [Rickettsia hoogstraalii]
MREELRSNSTKQSQEFLYYLMRLPRRFAPRNDIVTSEVYNSHHALQVIVLL